MSNPPIPFSSLDNIGTHLREQLEDRKFILLYAYNGTGKTRLSTAFKNLGKESDENGETIKQDTLYFNAFTEDLFIWNNDLENDSERSLRLNTVSTFFIGLEAFEMETRVQRLLEFYADFEAAIDTDNWEVTFTRDVTTGEGETLRTDPVEGIKVSRSEENIFIWCFFLAVVELVLDNEIEAYEWVKYVYVDDPISSLDDQNAAQVAIHLTQVFDGADDSPGVVVSTHHPMFHNVLWNELRGRRCRRYFLGYDEENRVYSLYNLLNSTPFFHHIATLIELYELDDAQVEKKHFNMLRAIAEKTATFHGYRGFEQCIDIGESTTDARLKRRFLNLYSHGGYAHFEANGIQEQDKQYFRGALLALLRQFAFNEHYFPGLTGEDHASESPVAGSEGNEQEATEAASIQTEGTDGS